jgi:hypothetical protein
MLTCMPASLKMRDELGRVKIDYNFALHNVTNDVVHSLVIWQ